MPPSRVVGPVDIMRVVPIAAGQGLCPAIGLSRGRMFSRDLPSSGGWGVLPVLLGGRSVGRRAAALWAFSPRVAVPRPRSPFARRPASAPFGGGVLVFLCCSCSLLVCVGGLFLSVVAWLPSCLARCCLSPLERPMVGFLLFRVSVCVAPVLLQCCSSLVPVSLGLYRLMVN